jgi:hypothetical protein
MGTVLSSVPWNRRIGMSNSCARATWSKALQSKPIRSDTAHSVVVASKVGSPRSSACRSRTALQSSTGASRISARTREPSGDSWMNCDTIAPPMESPSRTKERAPSRMAWRTAESRSRHSVAPRWSRPSSLLGAPGSFL